MQKHHTFALLVLVFVPLISGQTWYVSPTGTGVGTQADPFGNISIAVSTAQSGQTIILTAGTFTGAGNYNVNLGGKVLTITGQGWRNTIIDCNQLPNSAIIAAGTTSALTISGVSVINCQRSSLSLRSTATHSVTSCYFGGNQTPIGNGGGIGISSGTVTVTNCIFENNQQSAIWTDTGNLTVVGSRFSYNTPFSNTQGGAITFAGAGTGSVSNSTFIGNANAISQNNGALSVRYSDFFNNSFPYSVQCTNPGFVTETGNSFCGPNGITNLCGGWNPYPTYYDGCLVCRGMNEAKDCNGVCWGPNTNCQPPQTVSVFPGGNIQNAINSINTYRGQVILAPGTYSGAGNVNLNFGGRAVVLKSKYSDPLDVTIDCLGASTTGFTVNSKESFDTLIEGITIKNCSSSAISISSGSAISLNKMILTNSFKTTLPGGAAVRLSDSFISIRYSTISNNRAIQPGGAIHLARTASPFVSWAGIYETQFVDNQCDSYGGAINMDPPNGIEIRNSYFTRNTASSTDRGGAIYTRMDPGTALIISGTTFFNNSYLQPVGIKETVYCGTIANTSLVTFDVNTGNTFCSDANSNVVTCGGWTPGFTAVVDTCGVCNGGGRNLDCAGQCFGYSLRDPVNDCCRRSQADCAAYCARNHVDNIPSSITAQPVCCLNDSVAPDRNAQPVCCLLPNRTDVCGICGGNGQCCPVQCKNGGTCSGSTCICVNGWSGNDCSVNGLGCPQGCINGVCVAPLTCQCFDSNDQSSNCAGSDVCGPVTCLNGGTCADSGTGTCNCSTNWTGRNCTTPVCNPTCKNGGRCIAPSYCQCTSGWSGSDCSAYYCTPHCLNGGTCSGPGVCTCPPNYSGPRCNEYTGLLGESESSAAKMCAAIILLLVALLL